MIDVVDTIMTVPVRIRFAGTPSAETFHMVARECDRFHADWKMYLAGSGLNGSSYSTDERDQSIMIALNFNAIAYVEPGKIY